MELRELELFVTVAEELHFGRAAERAHLSQPALTQAIARLERRLGARLLERTTRRVSLTPAGGALLGRARGLLDDARGAGDLVARVARGEVGSVRVGVVGTAMLEPVPALVRAVRAAHPDLRLELTEQTGAAQLAALRAGRLDLGILHADAGDPPAGVDLLELRPAGLALALPADHPLARRRAVRLIELRDDPLVVIREESEADTHSLYLAACADAGFAPAIGAEVTSLGTLLNLVAAGLGWAFVADPVVRTLHRDGVAYARARGVRARLPMAIAWPAGSPSPPAARVRDIAASLRGPGGGPSRPPAAPRAARVR